jgi:hypothetical protein
LLWKAISATAGGRVKTTWKYAAGSNSAWRAASHPARAWPWHFGPRILGAVPVAAGVAGVAHGAAVRAALDVAAQRRSPAQLDGAHHPPLDPAQVAVVGATTGVAVPAEHVRQLQIGRHALCANDDETRIFREFKLEGYGSDIPWLCPEFVTRRGFLALSERPQRRVFTAKDKLRILDALDRVAGVSGATGAILRREGVYSSSITEWRRQRAAGAYGALSPAPRGPKPVETNLLTADNAELMRENKRLKQRLERAEAVIEIQKKVAVLLNLPAPNDEKF